MHTHDDHSSVNPEWKNKNLKTIYQQKLFELKQLVTDVIAVVSDLKESVVAQQWLPIKKKLCERYAELLNRLSGLLQLHRQSAPELATTADPKMESGLVRMQRFCQELAAASQQHELLMNQYDFFRNQSRN